MSEMPRTFVVEKIKKLQAPLKKLIYEWWAQHIRGRKIQQTTSLSKEKAYEIIVPY